MNRRIFFTGSFVLLMLLFFAVAHASIIGSYSGNSTDTECGGGSFSPYCWGTFEWTGATTTYTDDLWVGYYYNSSTPLSDYCLDWGTIFTNHSNTSDGLVGGAFATFDVDPTYDATSHVIRSELDGTATLSPSTYYAILPACHTGLISVKGDPDFQPPDGGIWSAMATSEDNLLNYFGTPPESYYAQIENTSTLNFYDASSTSASILKTLPADWIIQVVSSTDVSGSPMTDDSSNTWFYVSDPTDGTTGWIMASDTTAQYISSYDGSAQMALETSSTAITVGTSTGETGDYVLSAIDSYYNESSTAPSLYSNNDDTGIYADTTTPPGSSHQSDISIFKQRGFEEKLILGIAALEDGGTGFNNQIVTDDYGHGAMQVTPDILFYEQSSSNAYSSKDDPRGLGSGVTILPCASYMTSTYTNCYADSGSGDGSDLHYYIPDTSIAGSPTFKEYSNTPQSIYANVKDGMQILAGKYGTSFGAPRRVCDNYPDPFVVSSSPPEVEATTTYSCTDEEMVDVTAAYHGSAAGYLSEVADALTNISSFFPSVTSTDASTTDLINKLNLANNEDIFLELHSPGDPTIQDSHGHIIGVVNGVVTDTFPFASYDPETKSANIFFPQDDNLTYKITGTGSGVYGLDIVVTSGTQRIAFHRDENVPIIPGEVDTYTIDPNAVVQGKNGVTVKIDKKGNGKITEVDQFGATITYIAQPKFLSLPSSPFIPIVLPRLPDKVKSPISVHIYPVISVPTSTNTFTSTAMISSSTLDLRIASSTLTNSSTLNQ